jgi:hypothetical protein
VIPARKNKALRAVNAATARFPRSELERSLIASTIAGFRSTFRCDPERFERIYEDGQLVGIACVGMVDPEKAAV